MRYFTPKTNQLSALWTICLAISVNSVANAATIDFSTDDGGKPLVNGQSIESPEEFGNLVSIRASAATGAAIFDSTPGGPNTRPETADLLVGLGNVLVVQSHLFPTQTVPDIFDVVSDASQGGSLFFDFVSPSRLESITLVDIDENANAELTLTDTGGNTRTYSVPTGWTNDGRVPNGFAELDLTSLDAQVGETAELATATETPGFDAGMVTQLQVTLFGSGAVDNLVFVPEPSFSALSLPLLLLAGALRRRRQ